MARRLADGVWMLDTGLVPPIASKGYLVDEGEEGGVTLVDAGLFVNYPSLRGELADAGYEPDDIDRVLVTHYDLDHVGGLARLTGFDGPVYMGAADVALVRRKSSPGWFHHKGAFHRIVRRWFDMGGRHLEPVADGEAIGNFTAFHTPGHNPGHTVYVHEGLGAAFLGDLVWGEPDGLTTPFWLDSYDMAQVRKSVREFAERARPFELALMAHGSPVLEEGDDAIRRLAESL
jgi:glyoxylase-like metal-dependent hydrolase (beta-lactamase superfamily II)